ncbi:SCO family protein [Egicoccus halophilus]|uniref:SCO family protein n=1 Tax=Egicoccus halophilus TaxID=1670830 RepID=A0A8J3ETR8_9ACTN|nr:SCO family protein [Egicoccus halophilus]GGI06136.1 SCO family protein [Egicoccus halophilus]
MTLRRLLLPLLALTLLVAACEPTTATAISAQGLQRQSDGWHGVPLEVEREMPDVTLLDTDGNEVNLREATAGTPTLLFFGYTSCPDICPVHLAVLAGGMRETRTTTEQVQVVFVSVDPERDTPARIDEYLASFDSRFLGLHAELPVVEDALRQLDLPGPVVEGPDPRGEGDLIGHPAQIVGFDADGEARRVWPFGARRSDWVFDLPRIVEQWSAAQDEAAEDAA